MEDLRVLENELVPVYQTSTGEKVVYGTELHKVLQVKTSYKDWSARRFLDIDAIEYENYEVLLKNERNSKGGRPSKEHIIKLDTAKEMAMLERNDKGKQVRRYFIQVEKKYRESEAGLSRENQLILSIVNATDVSDRARALSEYKQVITVPLLETISTQQGTIKQQVEQLQIQRPYVQFAIKVQNADGLIDMKTAAKLLVDDGVNIGRNKLFELLRGHKVLMADNTPYQKYVDLGLFRVKLSTKETHWGTKMNPVTLVTGKGLIFLNKKLRDWMGLDSLDVEI